MDRGLVLWGVKSIFYVLDMKEQKEYKCTIKGKILDSGFNLKGRRERTPVVVGDIVNFEKTGEGEGLIVSREERKNEFKRLKRFGREVQTIVANIDLLLVVDSINNPPLRTFFIDRCLFTADYMNIPAVVVINKIELLEEKQKEFYYNIKSTYQELGYPVLETSAKEGRGLEELKALLKDRLSSFNGRSGVGKSSLIRTIDPRYKDIKIGEVSKKFDRGVHTTTYSKIYDLSFGGSIADTPGIRELAIFIDSPEDVERCFRDFNPFRGDCRFSNCQHLDEPECAVQAALEDGRLKEFRFESYLRMRETVEKLNDSRI